jgi:hypothetical protein
MKQSLSSSLPSVAPSSIIFVLSGLPPKLHGYGTVPEWMVVAMGFIMHDFGPGRYASMHWAKWDQDLTSLVKSFHDKELVHGDLRDVNFIIPKQSPAQIMLIDFDWGRRG